MCCAVENERLSWELEQLRGMVNMQELTRLRSEIDGLREEMLHMADRAESLQVTHFNHMHAEHACPAQCSLNHAWLTSKLTGNLCVGCGKAHTSMQSIM